MHGRLGVEGAQTPSVLWVPRVSGSPLLPRWARRGREGMATLGWKEAGWPSVKEQPRERRHIHPRRPVSSPDPPKDQIRGQRALGSEKHISTNRAWQRGWGFVWFFALRERKNCIFASVANI